MKAHEFFTKVKKLLTKNIGKQTTPEQDVMWFIYDMGEFIRAWRTHYDIKV